MFSFDVIQRAQDSQTGRCNSAAEADLIDSGSIHGSLISATDWQAAERPTTLKQNQFSVRLVKGGRSLQIAVQKICPSFSQEKRSFRFINSRLKCNYLPIDLNHQQKDNRTKSCFFFSHYSIFFYVVLFFSSSLHFRWVNQILPKIHGGTSKVSKSVSRKHWKILSIK